MSSVSELVSFFASSGIGTAGTDLFGSHLPDKPDAAVAVIPTPGRESIQAMAPGRDSDALEIPRYQLVSRASGFTSAFNRAYSAFLAADGVGSVELSGVEWLQIIALGPPELLRRDQNDRPEVIISFEAVKRAS